jgi:hypothetical protein
VIEPPADEYVWVMGSGAGATVVGVVAVVGVVCGDVGGPATVVPGAAGALVDGAAVDDTVPVGGMADGAVVVGPGDVLAEVVVTVNC